MGMKVASVMMGLFFAVVLGLAGCGGGGGGDAGTSPASGGVSKYAGKYSGTFSGGDSGTWNMTVSSTGAITGSTYSSIYKTTGAIAGSMSSNGVFNLASGISTEGASFTGTVDASGKAEGTWKNTTYNLTGTCTGQQTEGLIPPSTGPTVTAFVIPSTSTSLTVSVTSFIGTDSTGITGYYVSLDPTTPSSSASGWTSSKPTILTFTSGGSKTVYAWVKNAAEQVSSSASDSVTITISSTGITPFVGTWTGELSSSSSRAMYNTNSYVTLTIAADGKYSAHDQLYQGNKMIPGTYDASGTIVVNGNTISNGTSNDIRFSLTMNSDGKTLSGTWSSLYGYSSSDSGSGFPLTK